MCGVATFTSELGRVAGDREVVVLHPPEEVAPYPIEVHHRIRRDERTDYAEVASKLASCVDVAAIQHDYGIWGGPDGEAVLDFVQALRIPSVATLHAVLPEPTARQRAILLELVAATDATIVTSNAAAMLLADVYGVDPTTTEVIPHGVPSLPIVEPAPMKAALDLAGRDIILSVGLLSPRKNYELVIDALPAIIAEHPAVCYVIVGSTHPDHLRLEGERYRTSLEARVAKLRLGGHVRFVDRFVGRVELMRWLQAADILVTPFRDLDRVASGSLAYAMGAGRAVVSTPYAYAVELLSDDRGVLVEPDSSGAFAAAIDGLLRDDDRRAALGRRAHEHSRGMLWSVVGGRYEQLLSRVAAARPTPMVHGRRIVRA